MKKWRVIDRIIVDRTLVVVVVDVARFGISVKRACGKETKMVQAGPFQVRVLEEETNVDTVDLSEVQ